MKILQLNIEVFLLFRVVEAHRTDEATATPDFMEGASLSDYFYNVRTIRGFDYQLVGPLSS